MNKKQQEWIEKSYSLVAENGLDNLNIHSIARIVNKSKSSFYHYFGDLDTFRTYLLEYHLKQVGNFSSKINQCQNIDPDLIDLFLEHKVDIFFHKQLRIQRHKPDNNLYIEKCFELYEMAILDLLANYFDLHHNKFFAQKFNRFFSEHFLLSITKDNYTYEWLKNYLKEVHDMAQQMKISK